MKTSMSFRTLIVAGTLVVGTLLASASPAMAQGRGGRGGSPSARGFHGGGPGHGHGHGGHGARADRQGNRPPDRPE